MPREKVAVTHGSTVEITWGKGVQMQVTLVPPDDPAEGRGIVPPYMEPLSASFSLSRSQINNLLRVLRKARDQSYGADV